MTSARNPLLPGVLVLLAAGVVLAAAAKAPKGPELTPADQVTIEKIKAADPQAKAPVAGGKAVLTLPPRSVVTLYGKAQ